MTPERRAAAFAAIFDRMGKLVPMFGSDQPSEAAAAIAAAGRLLGTVKLDWHDVVAQLGASLPQPPLVSSFSEAAASWSRDPAFTFRFSRRPPIRKVSPPEITMEEARLREETRQHWAKMTPDAHLVWPDEE